MFTTGVGIDAWFGTRGAWCGYWDNNEYPGRFCCGSLFVSRAFISSSWLVIAAFVA